MPLKREAILVAVATVGTTLAPWGLAFIQSYAVDKRLTVDDLGYERVDVVVGAVLTGVIGLFIVVACAATLHVERISINDASDAAGALRPLAGDLASTLFGLGFLGAALLAARMAPLDRLLGRRGIPTAGGHQRQLRKASARRSSLPAWSRSQLRTRSRRRFGAPETSMTPSLRRASSICPMERWSSSRRWSCSRPVRRSCRFSSSPRR
jgi:hypothetical protein